MKRENILIILSFVVLAFFLARMFNSGDITSGPQRSQELIYSDFKALVAAGDVVNAQIGIHSGRTGLPHLYSG